MDVGYPSSVELKIDIRWLECYNEFARHDALVCGESKGHSCNTEQDKAFKRHLDYELGTKVTQILGINSQTTSYLYVIVKRDSPYLLPRSRALITSGCLYRSNVRSDPGTTYPCNHSQDFRLTLSPSTFTLVTLRQWCFPRASSGILSIFGSNATLCRSK